MRRGATLVLGLLGLSGCLSSHAGYSQARGLLQERLHAAMPAVEDDERASNEDVAALLARPLSETSAVQLALIRSPEIRAAMASIGIARGKLASALRLPNPTLEGDLRFRKDRSTPDVDIGGTVDLTELILLPLRQRASSADLDAASAMAASRSLAVVGRVRAALVQEIEKKQLLELEKQVLVGLEASADLSAKITEAGNTDDLASLEDRALYEESKLRLAEATVAEVEARGRLVVLLGLSEEEAKRLQVPERLEDPPAVEIDLGNVEKRADENNLDLLEARSSAEGAERRAHLATAEAAIPRLSVGALAERDPEGWGVGPQVGLGLPIFYQGEGEAASARAELSIEAAHVEAISLQLRERSRALVLSLNAARERALHFKTTLLPLRARIVEHTQLLYNAMGASAFQLLDAKHKEILAGEGYVQALASYWETRAELELMLAGLSSPGP